MNTRLLFAIIISVIYFSYTLSAQPSLYVLESDVTGFPAVQTKFLPYDAAGKIISSLTAGDISVSDNGSPLEVTSLNCGGATGYDKASIVMAIDLGTSRDFGTTPHFTGAIDLAGSIIDALDTTSAEAALTSYDFIAYVNQDFTSQRSKLRKALGFITPGPGSFIDTGFTSSLGGALTIAAKGQSGKSVIFITDGIRQVNKQSIIDRAAAGGIHIFCVSMSDTISADLMDIATASGGYWFKGLPTASLAKVLLSLAYNYQPCVLSIKGAVACEDRHQVQIVIPSHGISGEYDYYLAGAYKPRIESSPSYIGFSAVTPGSSRTSDIVLTARNGDITITKFTFNEPTFSVVAGDVPAAGQIVIPDGSSHTISVQFSPVDSAIVYTPLLIESNACQGNEIYITGGYPNTPPKTRTIHITSPTRGQTLIVGDTVPIKWEGLLPADLIQLEYSLDSATTWDTLATDVTGLEHHWAVPDTVARHGLIRAIQLWPNNIGETKDFHHASQVNSANFNKKDGTYIITACNDSCAHIWNSNTGAHLLTLRGHAGGVTWAVIDSSETYAATSSLDTTLKLWNFKTGALIHTFTGHKGPVTSCNFNPGGSKLISSSYDGTAIIWDLVTMQPVDTINCQQGRIRHAIWDKYGKEILTAGGDGTVRLWNEAGNQLIRSYSTYHPNEAISQVSFSPEGDKIVAATTFGRAFIWNKATGDTIYTVAHSDTTGINTVFSGDFHRTGVPLAFRHYQIPANTLLLLTSGADGAKIWDGETGSFIASLIEHRLAVSSAFFNFDGSRIVTSSWDSTAKVWNLDKRGLQIDTVGYFSINRVAAQCPDVDFGNVALSEALDTTCTPFIVNTAGFAYAIKDIWIDGANAANFSIIDGFAPYNLDSAASMQIRLNFTPGFSGRHSANINIKTAGGTITRRLTGNGYDPGLFAVTRSIDFGEVDRGDFKDSVIDVCVRNRSASALTITQITKAGPDSLHFNPFFDGNPIVLAPNQTLPLKLRFSPETADRSTGQILFVHSAEGSPTRISVFGEGVNPSVDSAVIYLPDSSGAPGQIIEMPVYIKNYRKNNAAAAAGTINIDLLFNATLLDPLDYDQTVNISNGRRRIKLALPAAFGDDSILSRIRFRVGLGDDSLTSIAIENIEPATTQKIALIARAAVFKINGLCNEGGTRLFFQGAASSLSELRPNPSQGNADLMFDVIEAGHTTISLSDLDGNLVKILFDKYTGAGTYSIHCNFDDIPSGAYIYSMKTNEKLTSKRMEIIK